MDRGAIVFRIAGASWVGAWVVLAISGIWSSILGAQYQPLTVTDLRTLLLVAAIFGVVLSVPAYLVGVRRSRLTALVGAFLCLPLIGGGLFAWGVTCNGVGPVAVYVWCANPSMLYPAAGLLIAVFNLLAAVWPADRSQKPADRPA